jgi:hypothetical protein
MAKTKDGVSAFFIVALLGVAAVVMAGEKLEKLGDVNKPDANGRTPLQKLMAAGGLLAALPFLGSTVAALVGESIFWPLGIAVAILAATGTLGWAADALGIHGIDPKAAANAPGQYGDGGGSRGNPAGTPAPTPDAGGNCPPGYWKMTVGGRASCYAVDEEPSGGGGGGGDPPDSSGWEGFI